MQIIINPEHTVVHPAQTLNVDLSALKILAIRDFFEEQTIVARVTHLPHCVVLWSGSTEYAAASAWNNKTAYAQLTAVLELPEIPWFTM